MSARFLPNDYARCGGLLDIALYRLETEPAEGDQRWHASCEHCLRRTSPRVGTDDGDWIAPPAVYGQRCPEQIL